MRSDAETEVDPGDLVDAGVGVSSSKVLRGRVFKVKSG